MRYLLTGEQMQQADRYTIDTIGIPSMVLMERAALASVQIMEEEQLDFAKVLVVCGMGNNGGDGYAIARLLHLKGISVELFFAGKEEKRSLDNRKQQEICQYYNIPTVQAIRRQGYSLVIDCIFGANQKREVTGTYYDLIHMLNHMEAQRVSIDVPSGIADDNGKALGIAFCADLTIAIAYGKRGLYFGDGALHAGKIKVAEIGITDEALPDGKLSYTYDRQDLLGRYPKRKSWSHKGTYGKVLVIAGSKGMCGAAYLCAKAAYASGAGLVQIYTASENRIPLQELLPEAIVTTYEEYEQDTLLRLLGWADVVAMGPGLATDHIAQELVYHTLRYGEVPCVLDADGLNIVAMHKEWLLEAKMPLVLTPHMKEMTRLLGCTMEELTKNRFEKLQSFVDAYALVCVLKDARTLVAKREEKFYINTTGCHAMAKGGSGDVLTGIIAGVLGQKKEAYEAAVLGTCLHGLAGESASRKKGAYSVLARDIIDEIGEIIDENL